ncbi:glycosyltransferase family 1 [Fusarium albosuccineum]|uniref:Glycosyltransferase family 1 n=1 Tax=Fusarium albosuccineum TaxID=1237068 RepID=A0A8H4PDT3_9HYPO|nr:glycosyltransferase family 1 [Fusarium albosuccineum]
MQRTSLIVGALLVAFWAIWTATRPSTPSEEVPLSLGRRNVVLFVTTAANGLANVHLATSHTLLSQHPSLEVHYASFAKLKPDVDRAGESIIWHELPPPDILATIDRAFGSVAGLAAPPGLKGIDKLAGDVQTMLTPWTVEEHWNLYKSITKLIQEVDPALVVVDPGFRPAVEATQDTNYMHLILCPNSLIDSFAHKQPWAAILWKYPPVGSGHPYPVPWSLIPTNIYLQARIIFAAVVAPDVKTKRSYLEEMGVKKAMDLAGSYRPDVPWLSSSFPEASLPMEFIPEGAKYCGPIVLERASLQEQDAEMAEWLRRAPTMLVNLGSSVRFNETQARSMVDALMPVLEQTDTQILWKIRRLNVFDDAFLDPVKEHVASRRLRIESWIEADPTALLATGNIKVSVHPGGANCYNEAVLYGVPQVILPRWFDLYNYASTAEYLGVGIWPTKDTAPDWNSTELGLAFLEALSNETMKKKAQELGEIARQYDGRTMAAREIAAIAARGHE